MRETTNEREWESLDEARVGNLHQLLAGIQSLKHRVEAPPASPVARRAEENPDDPGAWGWTIAVVGTTAAGAGITIMIISPEPVSTISGIATVAGAIASLGNFGRNVYMEVKESDPEKLTIEGEKRTDLHNPSRTLLTIFQEEMESIYSEDLEEEIVWEELEREFNERRELEELEQTDPTREYPSSGHIPW